MDCYDAILTRRSIRRFTAEPVEEELLERLLRAAMAAPSARNMQPWELVVVTAAVRRRQLAEIIPHGKMLSEAPLALLLCGNLERSVDDTRPPYWVVDCAAAAQNVLLAAHSLGLGGVWLGVFPREDRMQGVAAVLDLPDTIVPHSLLALGHPAEAGVIKDKFDPHKVHRESWRGVSR
ncbi:MAG TPA: nitroreductase family protein [Acidobacteriota bacterium]|nr:nitroreductase family protein [Acidobacteriota bacterium]HQF86550.1 nitroreductase family protein [Acidobacteriota bacterium]HQG90198.1 nitroreductase family protein [Acidobacteriota bacterium]HQK87540.1 nitroreductase family protein [Acidobacteriota bacterium]